MMTQPTAVAGTVGSHDRTSCDPGLAVTRSLLGYGLLAGPVYVGVSLAQALSRPGFDLTRHPWSLLANGHLGWIQTANLVLSGLMTVAFAAGLRRRLEANWAPGLIAVYGLCLVAAGIFRADPADGFPLGTPAGPGPVSWHGVLHLVAGGIGFSCLAAASLLLAARFARRQRPGWAWFSGLVGVLFLAGFAGVASGPGNPWTTLGFVGAVVLVCSWTTALAGWLYRTAR